MVFNLISLNFFLCSNHTGFFSFRHAKHVSILSFGNYCAFCLECSSPRSLHGCLLLDIQISTQMSLLTDVFPPILPKEIPPPPHTRSSLSLSITLSYLFFYSFLALSVIFLFFPIIKVLYVLSTFNFYKIVFLFLKY